MGIGGRGRAIHGIAAGAGTHEHDAHAIGLAAIYRLEIAMVECVLAKDGDDGLNDLLV